MCWWMVISNHAGGAARNRASSCALFRSYDAVTRSRWKRSLKYSAASGFATFSEKSPTHRQPENDWR